METAWAAGLFDGRGTACLSRGRRRLAVKMADEGCVRRFGAAVGVGKVYGPYGDAGSFMWVAEEAEAEAAARVLLSLVSGEKAHRIRSVCS